MFCVGYGIYTREHNQHNKLYNLFSTDPAVSCVADKQVSHHEIYTLCSILMHFILVSVISCLAMDAFTWDKWILLAAFLLEFFSKLSGKHFTDHTL